MLKQGMETTLYELNGVFLDIYRNMNGILPDRALTITSGQIYYSDGGMDDGMQYPSMSGMQYFDKDPNRLIVGDVIDKIDMVL